MLDFRQEVIDEDSFLTINMVAGVAVVDVECQVIRERQASILASRLARLAEEHHGQIAVCLRSVRQLSLATLRDLIEADRLCRSLGGRLAVFSMPVHIQHQLRETGLLKKLNLQRDAAAAVRFAQRRRPLIGRERAA